MMSAVERFHRCIWWHLFLFFIDVFHYFCMCCEVVSLVVVSAMFSLPLSPSILFIFKNNTKSDDKCIDSILLLLLLACLCLCSE
mmetsp:Transcript_21845/g.23815  ORF Transcript_21845/g.23815 Transcript_21845/m.23815 type:complete len:84 (+) Transcript_21845:1043-1294(+)